MHQIVSACISAWCPCPKGVSFFGGACDTGACDTGAWAEQAGGGGDTACEGTPILAPHRPPKKRGTTTAVHAGFLRVGAVLRACAAMSTLVAERLDIRSVPYSEEAEFVYVGFDVRGAKFRYYVAHGASGTVCVHALDAGGAKVAIKTVDGGSEDEAAGYEVRLLTALRVVCVAPFV